MPSKKKAAAEGVEHVTITPPKFQLPVFTIEGDAPYVQNAFTKTAQEKMHTTQAAGSTAKKGSKREPKDFDRCFAESQHRSADGWAGIPASAFRNAMVDVCRACGYKMTHAKLAAFVVADGFDAHSKIPLVRITKGEPEYLESPVPNANSSCDLRVRAMWAPGWQARVKIRFDADMFTLADVTHLLMRAGMQVGIGAGRPYSKNSAGTGCGTFTIVEEGKK